MENSTLDSTVEDLARSARLAGEVVHHARFEPETARYSELDPPLPERLRAGLASTGVERLFSHQVAALAAIRSGKPTLVTTPTASGKSLVFQIPALEEAARGGDRSALFLFPLKALGQDQRAKLDALATASGFAAGEFPVAIYDGDTPTEERARIRALPPRVLITNPDMLHRGLLSNGAPWQPFFSRLGWVVLDELHVYRGVFGSHFHHVLARLGRWTRDAGPAPKAPVWIASSATAENAADFAAALAGAPFEWIRETGAPRSARHVVLVRPAASPYTTALGVFTFLLERGLKTILFTKARRITELLFTWLRRQAPELARRVASYRAGFLPSERREIERRLFSGELAGVIVTSALEMGIDVGGLDACVLAGYPGSRMALWQRAGRVGRGEHEALTVMVALPDALDQYLLDHPEELLDRACEPLLVDPENEPVARAELVCAAAEKPLERDRDRAYLERFAPVIGDLLRENQLVASDDGREMVARTRRPHLEVNLRGAGAEIAIVDRKNGRTLGTVDAVRARSEVHPGAIYLHAGRSYAISGLDLEERRADGEPCEVDYFTTALTEKETEILEVLAERDRGDGLRAALGRLRVTERVVGFERKQVATQEVLDRQPLELPPSEFETVGVWWLGSDGAPDRLAARGQHFLGSLHAVEHAAIGLLPLLALCDRNDLGGISLVAHPQLGGVGAVFVYDGHAGGAGLAARGFRELVPWLTRVAELLARCPCEAGCPSCVQSPKCGNGNRPLDKAGARSLLELWLEPASGTKRKKASGRNKGGFVLEASSTQWPVSSLRDATARKESVPEIASSHRGSESNRAVAGERPPRELAPESRGSGAAAAGARGGTVLFDVETLRSAEDVGGWNLAHKMGLAVGVVCHLEEGRFETFREERARELVETLKSASLVVGFNSRRFDYAVLGGYTGEDLGRLLPTLDLLEEIHRQLGFRLGLGHLAEQTLGVGKSADGLQSLQWVREGRLDLVEAYCRRDVEVLRDLYLFGRREGFVCYADRTGRKLRLPVKW